MTCWRYPLIHARKMGRYPKSPDCFDRPGNPKAPGWYRCVKDYFEEFVRVYDDRFAKKFGFWGPHIEKVIHRFLDCACQDSQYPKCAMDGTLTEGAGISIKTRDSILKILAKTFPDSKK